MCRMRRRVLVASERYGRFPGSRKSCQKNDANASSAPPCSRGFAVAWPTQWDLRRTGVLVASRETLNTTATTRRKIPARVGFLQKEFSEKRT